MNGHRWGGTVLVLALVPAVASGNIAAPWRSGQPVGEPAGLRTVRIERETLILDLRPLSAGTSAVVEATYQLYNQGDTLTTDLVFVSGSLIGDQAGVWLDEQAVPHDREAKPALPPSWQPPRQTPGLGGGRDLDYRINSPKELTLAFRVNLAPGPHTLRVKYDAKASAYSGSDPTRYWQLGYVLAPARDWGGFGQLDVKVLLSSGWAAASTPELTRQGDELVGSFTGIPADALALTVQAPPRTPAWVLTGLSWLCAVLALIGGPVLIWRWSGAVGRNLGAEHRSLGRLWLVSFGLGVAWLGLLIATGFLVTLGQLSLAAAEH